MGAPKSHLGGWLFTEIWIAEFGYRAGQPTGVGGAAGLLPIFAVIMPLKAPKPG
jgi:hypothetical protein